MTTKNTARTPTGGERLATDDQTRLDRLIRVRGYGGAARDLSVDPGLVEKLAGGGYATPRAVARVTEKLRRMSAEVEP